MSDEHKAVFLSYASQDAEAAKRICEALRQAGVEVWFDLDELVGGDAWDQKIRRQIGSCTLFMPVISASTQARTEGYFRLEWRLADRRTELMGKSKTFLLPVCIDDTRDSDADVPDSFMAVQWTRLKGGETTPAFCARVKKLLERSDDVARVPRPVIPESTGRETRATPKSRPWLIPVIVGTVAIAVATVWLTRGAPAGAATSPDPKSQIPSPNSPSEARQLAAQARELFDALDGTRDDFKLAEELLAKARAKGDLDAEVWAAEAQLHARYIQRGWDIADTRRESARAASQRALRLDPQSFEARLVAAFLLGEAGSEGEEKERRLRELRTERPTDQRLLRALASVLNRLGKQEEAYAINDESAALPGGDPLALYNKSQNKWFAGRTAEAEQAIQASLAQRSFTGALLMSAWYTLILHADTDGARATLARIPPAEMLNDRAAYFAYYVEKLAHRPGAAITRLQAVPRDWLNDVWYRGPKGQLVGDALHADGRTAAAMAEWRSALQLVDEKLTASPNDFTLRNNRLQLLARLGEQEQAAELFALFIERYGIDPAGDRPVPGWVTNACIWLGRKPEAVRQIALGFRREHRSQVTGLTTAILRLDPLFDSLRTEPEFTQVIAEAEAIEQAAALAARPPRDWPKNPELKKAVNLLDRLDAIPEDIRLAEEIVQGVLDKVPTDPETVAAMARVQATWLLRGWDRSSDRYVKAQRVVERAVQLAPEEPEALAAVSIYLNQRGADRERARQLVERAIALEPGEPRFHRWRNELMWNDRTIPRAELFASLERTLARFPHDALVHYDVSRHYRNVGRFEESEREIDAALAIAPVANAMVWKARTEFGLRHNLPGMKAALDRVPARVRSIERTVFGYFIYAVMSGDHAVGVNALTDMAEPWMIDFDYRGPKALPLASLLELQGKPALARIQYEIALKELMQRQASEPDDLFLKLDEAWVLHGLGRDDEARAAVRTYNESIERPYRGGLLTSWWFHPIACNLVLGERGIALALVREAAELRGGREMVRRFMATDPRLTAFRDDREILALLAEPAAGK